MCLLIHPGSTKVLPSELHHSVEPLPEGKVAFGQWLFAELRPSEHQVGCFRTNQWQLQVGIAESLRGKKSLVAFRQSTTSSRSKFGRERLGNLTPRHFFWNDEWRAPGLCECIVPGNCRPGMRLLVTMHDNYDGKRQSPDLRILKNLVWTLDSFLFFYGFYTWNTNSHPPTGNLDWKSRENFSSITDSVPFFSARFIFLSCMFLLSSRGRIAKLGGKLVIEGSVWFHLNDTDSCREAFWYSIVPVLLRISPEASPFAILSFFNRVLACCSLIIDTVTFWGKSC